jgi:hypothetical protein
MAWKHLGRSVAPGCEEAKREEKRRSRLEAGVTKRKFGDERLRFGGDGRIG